MNDYFSDSDVWAMVQALNPTISYSGGWTVMFPSVAPTIIGEGGFLMDALYDFYRKLRSCDVTNSTPEQ